MKPWVKVEMTTKNEQTIVIQPTPDMNGDIELYFGEETKNKTDYGPIYITKDDIPVFIKAMEEMINYQKDERKM